MTLWKFHDFTSEKSVVSLATRSQTIATNKDCTNCTNDSCQQRCWIFCKHMVNPAALREVTNKTYGHPVFTRCVIPSDSLQDWLPTIQGPKSETSGMLIQIMWQYMIPHGGSQSASLSEWGFPKVQGYPVYICLSSSCQPVDPSVATEARLTPSRSTHSGITEAFVLILSKISVGSWTENACFFPAKTQIEPGKSGCTQQTNAEANRT